MNLLLLYYTQNLDDMEVVVLLYAYVAFDQMSESEKASAAKSLVGKNAMSDFLALMNAAPADIYNLSGTISNCDGTSLSMAKTMQDNLAEFRFEL